MNFGRPRRRWGNDITKSVKEIEWESVDWISMAPEKDMGWAVMIMVKKTPVPPSQRTHCFCSANNWQCPLDKYHC